MRLLVVAAILAIASLAGCSAPSTGVGVNRTDASESESAAVTTATTASSEPGVASTGPSPSTGPHHQPPGPPPTVGPGATGGACDGLMASASAPAAIVRLEVHGHGEQVRRLRPDGNATVHGLDAAGCASVPLDQAGQHLLVGWYTCTRTAYVDWNGTSDALVEVYIPFDGSVCE